MDSPIFKTKIEGIDKKFNLTNPKEQEEYFELKAGKEIKKLREFFKANTFIAYLLGKKNSGKGTYAKMFSEIIMPEKIDHFSIGDMIRGIDKELADKEKKEELIKFLEKNYRGQLPLEEIISSLEGRSTKTLLPTELILSLIKREIREREKKSLFIDGFPRDLNQVNLSLFFRDLVGYRDDPDVFILIDVPEKVIDERIKWRRVCPICQTSRNLKLLVTSKVGFDNEKKEFYIGCDNPNCNGEKMVLKEGDEAGIEPIKERLKLDQELMEHAFSLHGVPKVLLRNSIPVSKAKEYIDDYEITPEYVFEKDNTGKIKIKEKPWTFLDDKGEESFSLLPQPVVVSMIKQLAKIFC